MTSEPTTFSVILQDECGSTVLDDFTVADLATNVMADALTVPLPIVFDSVSKTFGSMDGHSFCGARSYELVNSAEVASFLTLDDDKDTLTLKTDSSSDEGQHTITIRARLESMALTSPETYVETTLTVTINPCQVTAFEL